MFARSHDKSFWTLVLHWWDLGMNNKKKLWYIFFYKCLLSILTLFHQLKYYLISRSWSQIFWISLNQVVVCSVWYYWLLASDRGGSLFTPDISRFHARELSPLSRNFLFSVYYFYFIIFGVSTTLISYLQNWNGELHIFWRRGQERVVGGSEKWERDSNPCFIPSKKTFFPSSLNRWFDLKILFDASI